MNIKLFYYLRLFSQVRVSELEVLGQKVNYSS